ncbi:MAG: hypothetical protein JXB85_00885 [Anaerolineales bacterium]|nr:hypothetical protein [Anaerolineales bacterium]
MDKLDELDRMLIGLPCGRLPDGLVARAQGYVRRKRRRRQALRLGGSLLLAAGGLGLLSPHAASLLASASLSDPALGLLLDGLRVALAGLDPSLLQLWSGFSGAQTDLAGLLTVSTWLGLAALALSGLLGLGQLLSPTGGPLHEGESA